MTATLPEPILKYFKVDDTRPDTLSHCFTNTAVVKDEGNEYRGIEAIKKWFKETSAKYDYSCEPIRLTHDADFTIIMCKVTGNFPNSPLDLQYIFRLEETKIKSLEITL